MENKKNINNKNKFNSDLLSRPFSSYNNPIENTSNINSDNFILSSTSFFNNDPNASRISSVTNSVCFTKRDLTEFNQSMSSQNINNLNVSHRSDTSDISESFKKRKPFENLSFNSNDKVESFTKTKIKTDLIDSKNITCSINKANEETQISQTIKRTNYDNPQQSHNETQLEQLYIDNLSLLSEKEKSYIRTYSNKIDQSTLDKARQYNSQFTDSVPFWITFFSEIENNSLPSNSSYFKTEDRNKYVTNLMQMVKKDAELFDVMNNHKKVKNEVKNNIKSLLITELPMNNSETENESIDHNINVSKIHSETKSKLYEEKDESKSDSKIKEKLLEIIALYDKLDDKEKGYIKKTTNFEEHKLKLLSEGKSNYSDFSIDINKNISRVEERVSNCSKFIRDDEKEIEEYTLIDNIQFNDDDFKDVEYGSDMGVLQKASLQRLLDIDRQLNGMNPDKYKDSINTHLKKMQTEFIDGKPERDREFEEKYKKEVEKMRIYKDKKSIFDIKEADNKKIEYKDYLEENRNKKDKVNFITNLNKERDLLNNKPVEENRKTELFKELENYHIVNENTDEYKEKLKNIKGCYDENRVMNQLRDIDDREVEKKKLIISLDEKFKEREEEMDNFIDRIKEEFRNPYDDLMKDVDREYKDNRALMDRCDVLERYVMDAEITIDNIDSKMNIINKESEILKKLWNDADREFEPYDWQEDISDFPQSENTQDNEIMTSDK